MNDQIAITSTTQDFLDIYDITSNLVILKNGISSMIINVGATNFGLLAEAEQDASIFSYAGLLNSLNFPIQIVIQSQTKDASNYLKLLERSEQETTNKTKQMMIASYRNFVSQLIKERNVLDKKFYIVIWATPVELGLSTGQSLINQNNKVDISSHNRLTIIEKSLNILEPRRDHLIGQLARIGLNSYQLETQEIIKLFYNSYNPEAFEGQRITDTKNYTTPLVQADIFEQPPSTTTSRQIPPTENIYENNNSNQNQEILVSAQANTLKTKNLQPTASNLNETSPQQTFPQDYQIRQQSTPQPINASVSAASPPTTTQSTTYPISANLSQNATQTTTTASNYQTTSDPPLTTTTQNTLNSAYQYGINSYQPPADQNQNDYQNNTNDFAESQTTENQTEVIAPNQTIIPATNENTNNGDISFDQPPPPPPEII